MPSIQTIGYITKLSEAPETHIDPEITGILRTEAETMTAARMKELLDRSAFEALASDFGMVAMDAGLNMLRSDELLAAAQCSRDRS